MNRSCERAVREGKCISISPRGCTSLQQLSSVVCRVHGKEVRANYPRAHFLSASEALPCYSAQPAGEDAINGQRWWREQPCRANFPAIARILAELTLTLRRWRSIPLVLVWCWREGRRLTGPNLVHTKNWFPSRDHVTWVWLAQMLFGDNNSCYGNVVVVLLLAYH